VEYFFKRFDQFRQPPFHPKWNQINLASPLAGWTRFKPAEDLLAQAETPEADRATKQQFDDWVKLRSARGGRRMSDDEARVLFEQFRGWMKREGGIPAR
jgi:hypothetical protein